MKKIIKDVFTRGIKRYPWLRIVVPGLILLLQSELGLAADVTGDRLNIGYTHTLGGYYSTIAGGTFNTNLAQWSVISGGSENLIQTNGNDYGTIGGGVENLILSNSYWSTISGGARNSIEDANRSVIGGGDGNAI